MKYYEAFREKYAGITAAQQKWLGKVLRNKEITHETGITFYYPNASMSTSGYCQDFPSVCNYPVNNCGLARRRVSEEEVEFRGHLSLFA